VGDPTVVLGRRGRGAAAAHGFITRGGLPRSTHVGARRTGSRSGRSTCCSDGGGSGQRHHAAAGKRVAASRPGPVVGWPGSTACGRRRQSVELARTRVPGAVVCGGHDVASGAVLGPAVADVGGRATRESWLWTPSRGRGSRPRADVDGAVSLAPDWCGPCVRVGRRDGCSGGGEGGSEASAVVLRVAPSDHRLRGTSGSVCGAGGDGGARDPWYGPVRRGRGRRTRRSCRAVRRRGLTQGAAERSCPAWWQRPFRSGST
jgi:hypothetical protein